MATHRFQADAEAYEFSLDQTIDYPECSHRPLDEVSTVSIQVTRNFVVYAGTEQIVRFSQTNKVASEETSELGWD